MQSVFVQYSCRNKKRTSLNRKWPLYYTCKTEKFWIFWLEKGLSSCIYFDCKIEFFQNKKRNINNEFLLIFLKKALFQSIWQSKSSGTFSFTCIIIKDTYFIYGYKIYFITINNQNSLNKISKTTSLQKIEKWHSL